MVKSITVQDYLNLDILYPRFWYGSLQAQYNPAREYLKHSTDKPVNLDHQDLFFRQSNTCRDAYEGEDCFKCYGRIKPGKNLAPDAVQSFPPQEICDVLFRIQLAEMHRMMAHRRWWMDSLEEITLVRFSAIGRRVDDMQLWSALTLWANRWKADWQRR